ncbi:soluble scavenger receptor cysteine-rich domain-containing protein SSC5D-like [Penaeus vannamei]|uniref:soluble scavenger receptor cysteine-rich domain-containing protein SSC5D-like n=1 Tax=Penaeus vannamei TaxID=6689 RepID=UPI00387F388F
MTPIIAVVKREASESVLARANPRPRPAPGSPRSHPRGDARPPTLETDVAGAVNNKVKGRGRGRQCETDAAPSPVGPRALPPALEKVTTTGGRPSANKHGRQQPPRAAAAHALRPGPWRHDPGDVSRPPRRAETPPYDCPSIPETRLLPCGTLGAHDLLAGRSTLPTTSGPSLQPSGPSAHQSDVAPRRRQAKSQLLRPAFTTLPHATTPKEPKESTRPLLTTTSTNVPFHIPARPYRVCLDDHAPDPTLPRWRPGRPQRSPGTPLAAATPQDRISTPRRYKQAPRAAHSTGAKHSCANNFHNFWGSTRTLIAVQRHATPHYTTLQHTTLHNATPHTTQSHATPHYTTPRHTPLHNATPHPTTQRHATPHYTTPRHTTLHNATPHHATQSHATLHNDTPHHTTQRHATPHYTTLQHTPLHNDTPHHTTQRHATPHCTTPQHTTLYNATPHHALHNASPHTTQSSPRHHHTTQRLQHTAPTTHRTPRHTLHNATPHHRGLHNATPHTRLSLYNSTLPHYTTTRHTTLAQRHATPHYTTLQHTPLSTTTRHTTTTQRHATPRLHNATPHYTTPRHTPLHNATPHYTTPRHTTLHNATPHPTTQRYNTPHYTTPRHTTLHNATPHHTTQRYNTPHYTPRHTTLHNATPHCTTPRHSTLHNATTHHITHYTPHTTPFRHHKAL